MLNVTDTTPTVLQPVISGLYASPPEPLGFGPLLEMRAYLIQREAGNLLIYRSAALAGERTALEQLGGVARQYLNHRHEAAPVLDWVGETFSAALHVHADEEQAVAEVAVVGGLFSERHRLGDDFEVIPTPGHTAGATAFLWDSDEHRVLFTGDTLFFPRGRWIAAVLDGVSDRERYIESLELIRSLDFDVVVPSIATRDQPHVAFVTEGEARRQIDGILERLRGGANN